MADKLQEALDDVKVMESLYNEIGSLFQSKKDRLKKQVTHWTGKFMIVKAENNRLRAELRQAQPLVDWAKELMKEGTPISSTAMAENDLTEIIGIGVEERDKRAAGSNHKERASDKLVRNEPQSC